MDDAQALEHAPLAVPHHVGGPHQLHLSTGDRGLDRLLRGGLPARTFTVLSGPAFVGKDVFARTVLVRRILEGSPALIILTDASVREWHALLEEIDPRVAPALAAGRVQFIDVYSHQMGVTESSLPHSLIVPAPLDLSTLRATLDEACRRVHHLGHHPMMLFDTVSTLFHYADPQATFRLLRNLIGCARSSGYTGLLQLEPGEHDEASIQLVRRLCQGAIAFRKEGGRRYLQVEGLGLHGSEPWIEFALRESRFALTGSLHLGRIR
ncbi:MAG: hypothetical protein HYT80_00650 [Euryarchaeota archaeon]|nr:hypothetical protein [Euryarchaeota archaeon]